jgi:alkylated DNA repair dioxygenase AlkB
MAYHSDGEKDLKDNGAISSVSFGAERKFNFKHKTTKELVSLILENGSLLMMKDTPKILAPQITNDHKNHQTENQPDFPDN